MIHSSRRCLVARNRVRQILLVTALAFACSLQGCATSLETFGLGAGVGIAGAFGLLGCAIGCH
ncbi:hypothetical protein LMG24238_00128 [Paraburkholderia sediminicola]|uniref:Lipoprotein n=1 Tax=Paraburkholderia sediminicola TaxID=458836 RepID=A0A6J4ZPP2_9BURK|nr:hypothetical protein [Paraburkholderia sediminicola]CAB3639300.1 hypothetical protein LMG24238_00128 [Paraburkholderia sediminicola]